MSTRRKPDFSGPSKKISSWVRPGVCEVRASALRPVSALIRLDLPTLERPANATSMLAIGGSVSIDGEAQTNFHSPAKSFRPSSISFASGASVMRSFLLRAEAAPSSLRAKRSNPWAPQGKCGLLRRFAPRNDEEALRLLDGLLGEHRLEIV